MSCDRNGNGRVNRMRLAVLLGFLAMFGVGTMYAAFAVPALFGVLPLLLLAAACPALCTVGKVVSWVRGGKEVAELQRSG